MEASEAIAVINRALGKVASLRASYFHSPEHVEFIQTTGLELAQIFGDDSTISRNFAQIHYASNGRILTNVFTYEADMARARREAYTNGLNVAEGILLSARNILSQHDASQILRASRIRSEGARVFISHGREGPALTKLERFLRALGLISVVVIREASEGMAVDDLVEKRLSESDCAVILATGDDTVGNVRQPRPNVIHEIGLAQEKLDQRVIYLKEEGCEFPSNVKPKVWENFTHDNMERAFEKVSKELRAFGLL